MIHTDSRYKIIFGNKTTAFDPHEFKKYTQQNNNLMHHPLLIDIIKTLNIEQLIITDQAHTAHGVMIKTIDEARHYTSYSHTADFIITGLNKVGLVIITADCLPIIMYDRANHVLATIHAGWRGSIQKIALQAVNTLQKNYGTDLNDLTIFFGPCAQWSAYHVKPDFKEHLQDCPFIEKVLIVHNNSWHFNLPLYNQLLLESIGIASSAFDLTYNLCTIINTTFCSYRRDGQQSKRQMTIASLR